MALALCVIFGNAQEYQRFEAEDGVKNGGIFINNDQPQNTSGGEYVNGLYIAGAKLDFIIQAPSAGMYTLVFRYATAMQTGGTDMNIQLRVNASPIKNIQFVTTQSWGNWNNHTENVFLNQGQNIITLRRENFHVNNFILDYMWFRRETNNGAFNQPINLGPQKLFVKKLVEVADGRTTRFISFAFHKDRRFVVDNNGSIYEISTNAQGVTTSNLFFNVRDAILANTGRELNQQDVPHGGLRSVAFHPDFDQNGLFYTSVMEDRPLDISGHTYLSDQPSAVIQAEASGNNVTTLNNIAGFTGGGFLGQIDQVGDFINFPLSLTTEGQIGTNIFELRYSAGPYSPAPNVRQLNAYVDGVFQKSINFPVTGSWGNWQNITFELDIPTLQSTVSLRFDPPGFNTGRVNIDKLTQRLPADGVVIEWRYNNNTNQVIQNSYREVFRVGMPVYDHPIKQIAFNHYAVKNSSNPNNDYGLLYICHGDGSVQSAIAGGGQNLDDALGKLMRIDPTNGGSLPFKIPSNNPFANSNTLVTQTLFAYGFRNPHNLAFEANRNGEPTVLIADVGRANVEEINFARSGRNYGWAEREGTLIHNQNASAGTLRGVEPLGPNDGGGFEYPAAQWGHPLEEGRYAIAGSYVYTNPNNGEKYCIFGNFPQTGEIYYSNYQDLLNAKTSLSGNQTTNQLTQAPINQFEIYFDHDNNSSTPAQVYTLFRDILRLESGYETLGRVDFRFGQDRDGNIYITNKWNGYLYQVEAVQTGGVLGDGASGSGNSCTIEIYAAGKSNTESMALKLDGVTVRNWLNVGGSTSTRVFQKFTYTYNGSFSTLSVELTNDNGGQRDLRVDRIAVDGSTYQAEFASKFDAFGGNCNPSGSEFAFCNGGFLWNINGNCSGSRFNDKKSASTRTIVYPNPANNEVWVNTLSENAKLVITNLSGIQVDTRTLVSNSSKVDIRGFEPGVYFFSVSSNDSNQVFKIVKQ